MGNGKRLIIKQSLKYFIMILVFIMAITLGKILWSFDTKVHLWALSIAGIIFLIMVIFDLASTKDIIPLFKR